MCIVDKYQVHTMYVSTYLHSKSQLNTEYAPGTYRFVLSMYLVSIWPKLVSKLDTNQACTRL